MFSSSSSSFSSRVSSGSTGNSSTSNATNTSAIQSLEKRVLYTSNEEVEKKLASILLQVHQNQISSLDLTPMAFGEQKNNRALASASFLGSGGSSVQLLDYSSSCVSTLKGHSSYVLALAVLPNGSLASGSYDNSIKLWDSSSGHCLSTLTGHSSWARALAVLPNGSLVSGSGDNTIKLWEPKAKAFSLVAQQVQTVLSTLKNNTSVTSLNLSGHCYISDDVIDPLIAIFEKPGFFSFRQQNTTLKTIDLRKTGVTKKGIEKLQQVIQSQSLSVTILSDRIKEEKLQAQAAKEKAEAEQKKIADQQRLAQEQKKKEAEEKKAEEEKRQKARQEKEKLEKEQKEKEEKQKREAQEEKVRQEREKKEKLRQEQEAQEKAKKEKEAEEKRRQEQEVQKAREEKERQEKIEKEKKAKYQMLFGGDNNDDLFQPKTPLSTVSTSTSVEPITTEKEEKARQEAQEKARRELEEKTRKEMEEKAQKEAQEKEKKEAEEKAQNAIEEKRKSVVTQITTEVSLSQETLIQQCLTQSKTIQSLSSLDLQALRALGGGEAALKGLITKETADQLAAVERGEILKNDNLADYYFTFIRLLTEHWLACQVIHSGKVANDAKTLLEYVGKGIDSVGRYIPILNIITGMAGAGASALSFRSKQQAVNQIANFFDNLHANKIIETLARQLTLFQAQAIQDLTTQKQGVFTQIVQAFKKVKCALTVDDVNTVIRQKAAEDVKKILDAIVDEKLPPHPTLSDVAKLFRCVVGENKTYVSPIIQMVCAQSAQPTQTNTTTTIQVQAMTAQVMTSSTANSTVSSTALTLQSLSIGAVQTSSAIDMQMIHKMKADQEALQERLRQMEERAQKAEAEAKSAREKAEKAERKAEANQKALEDSGISVGGSSVQIFASASANQNPNRQAEEVLQEMNNSKRLDRVIDTLAVHGITVFDPSAKENPNTANRAELFSKNKQPSIS